MDALPHRRHRPRLTPRSCTAGAERMAQNPVRKALTGPDSAVRTLPAGQAMKGSSLGVGDKVIRDRFVRALCGAPLYSLDRTGCGRGAQQQDRETPLSARRQATRPEVARNQAVARDPHGHRTPLPIITASARASGQRGVQRCRGLPPRRRPAGGAAVARRAPPALGAAPGAPRTCLASATDPRARCVARRAHLVRAVALTCPARAERGHASTPRRAAAPAAAARAAAPRSGVGGAPGRPPSTVGCRPIAAPGLAGPLRSRSGDPPTGQRSLPRRGEARSAAGPRWAIRGAGRGGDQAPPTPTAAIGAPSGRR